MSPVLLFAQYANELPAAVANLIKNVILLPSTSLEGQMLRSRVNSWSTWIGNENGLRPRGINEWKFTSTLLSHSKKIAKVPSGYRKKRS